MKKEKVVIVGAGMAGLTAGAYLSREDYDVLMLDMNSRTGGLVSTFERDGFYFDTGPRAFVNSGMVKPILRDLEIEWEEIDNTISIAVEDKSFEIKSLRSLADYERLLTELYPSDKEDIKKIMKIVEKLSKHTEVLYEFDNPYFVDYTSNKKVLFKEFLPWLLKLAKSLRAFNKYGMPMEEFLEKLTDNQSLIDILTQLFFAKTPTYFALGYFQVYLDYFYFKNGTSTLPKLLEKKIIDDGGKIKLNTKVENILVKDKIVIDSEGNKYEYDHLIWSADLKTYYKQTNIGDIDSKVISKFNTQKEKVLSAKAAESVYVMFLAVDRPTSYFAEISGEHMFYTPSKKGLGKISKSSMKNLISNYDDLTKQEVFEWVEEYCDLNTFEVSIPGLRDPDLAPEGKTGIMISCLFDYEISRKIDESGWSDDFKEIMEKKIISLFSNGIFEGIAKDVIFSFSTTPTAINRLTGNSEGGIVGWSFEGESPVHNKLKDLAKAVLTPIPNIYQASQWAYAPAGVPIAMLTGWHASQKIKKKLKKK